MSRQTPNRSKAGKSGSTSIDPTIQWLALLIIFVLAVVGAFVLWGGSA